MTASRSTSRTAPAGGATLVGLAAMTPGTDEVLTPAALEFLG